MIFRISGEDLADQAITGNYEGLPYSEVDCQGLVERILSDCGVRKRDGSPYNWRGSNSMYRNYIRWRGTIEECRKKFGCIPQGAFLFIIKHDGGEVEKGYHDDLGNATHVGLALGDHAVIDSQVTGGVKIRDVKIFSHVGLMDMVDYYTEPEPPETEDIRNALAAVATIRDTESSDADILSALQTLTRYLKEVK